MSPPRRSRFRCLFVSSDRFPAFRVDVADLFGKHLAGRGHRIDWLLQSSEPCAHVTAQPWHGGTAWVGANNAGRSPASALLRKLRGAAHDLRLLSLARDNSYDFVLVKDKFFAVLLALLAKRLRYARFYYWLSFPYPEAARHNARQGDSRYPLFDRLRGFTMALVLYRVVARGADHVFVQSDQMKQDLVRRGFAPDRVTPVPMGVALERLLRTTAGGSEPRIVYLGALNRARRIDFLLRAFAHVHRQVPAAVLDLVGDAPDPRDRAALEQLAVALGIDDRVRFHGFLPMERAWEIAAAARVGASPIPPTPSFYPSSPTKTIEYMALGIPVVGNDLPDQKRVLVESGAGMCVRYTEEDFAAALVHLLENPVQARVMGARGRPYVEKHRSYAVLSERVEQVILAQLDATREAPRPAGPQRARTVPPSQRRPGP